MTNSRLLLLASVLLLGACSSRLETSVVSVQQFHETTNGIANEPTGEGAVRIDGIPFRIKERYTVHLYVRQDDGSYVPIVRTEKKTIANPNLLYAINFDSQSLSDHTLKIDVNPDGTLTLAKLTSESQAEEFLKAAGTAAQTSVDSIIAVREAEDKEKDAARQEQNTLELALIQAVNSVDAAQVALDNLAPDATKEQEQAAENALRLAKVQSNIAHRNSGLPPPYPDVLTSGE